MHVRLGRKPKNIRSYRVYLLHLFFCTFIWAVNVFRNSMSVARVLLPFAQMQNIESVHGLKMFCIFRSLFSWHTLSVCWWPSAEWVRLKPSITANLLLLAASHSLFQLLHTFHSFSCTGYQWYFGSRLLLGGCCKSILFFPTVPLLVGCSSPCPKYLINPCNAVFLRTSRMIFWTAKYTDTNSQIHKYII